MAFTVLPSGARAWRRVAANVAALALAGTLAAVAEPHLTAWGTPHTLPGRPTPVAFTGAVPDAGYDPGRWNVTSATVTTSRLYPLLGVGRSAHTTAGERDAWQTGVDAYAAARALLGHPAARAGLAVWRTGPGVLADGAGLRDHDVLLAIGSRPTPELGVLFPALRAALGHPSTVTFARAGVVRTVPVTLTRPAPARGRRGLDLLGFASADEVPVTVPAFWPVDRGGEGDSAGLMTALADLDALTPGDLSGGLRVAGTGAITPSGAVTEIGDAGVKVRGAAAAGAAVFFVPAGPNAAEAAAAGTGVPVVPVTSLAQAVAWLCAHGAAAPTCAGPAGGSARPG